MPTIKATQVRKGQVLVLDGELFQVIDYEHVTPGKGRAMNQIRCKNLQTGAAKQLRLGSDVEVEQAYLETRPATFSYEEGAQLVFMDTENYEQYFLNKEFVGDAMGYVRDNLELRITFHEGVPVSLELPAAVVLRIDEAEIAAKGDTVTNDKKRAVTETGLEVRVPPFIEAGEYVKINTETGEFVGRASAGEAG